MSDPQFLAIFGMLLILVGQGTSSDAPIFKVIYVLTGFGCVLAAGVVAILKAAIMSAFW